MNLLCAPGGRREACTTRLFVILPLVAMMSALVTSTAGAGEVQWRTSQAGTSALAATPADWSLSDQLTDLAARPDESHVVLYLDRPVDDVLRADLEDAGVRLLAYLGSHAFFAALDAERLEAAAVVQTGAVQYVAPIEANVKLHPMLIAGETPDWAVVGVTDGGVPIIGTYIAFHRDIDLYDEAIPLLSLYDVVVRDALESVNALVVELPMDVIYDLATEDAIQWIEQALPKFSECNDSNRSRVQADQAQATPYNLDGSGVTVLVYDGGTARSTHQDFGGRLTVYDYSGMDDHPTHVAGTIGGSGSASGGTYKGMAPGVTLLSYGFEWDSSGVFLYDNPGDLEDDYDEAIHTYGADIANNSIGTNTALYWDCDITGDYGVTSQLIDTIVRGDGSNPDFDEPFRVIWANGNERQTTRCGDTYNTTAPPACAKNHITVGAVNSDDDSMTSFSSWGPVDDGRMKPDIAAPGCQSNGDYGVTSTFSGSDTEYGTYCGTSMACPTVTGICALLLEDYRDHFTGQDDPRNSTLKILLAHNAVDLGNTGPDNLYGYGSVRIKDTIDYMRLGQFVEDEVSQGGVVEYSVEVGSGDSFKVTLAWDDYPGTPNVNPALVNDLDLRVYDPSYVQHYPWTLSAGSPGNPAVRTQADHVNNIEQVVVDSPAVGTWTVQVYGYDVSEGPQPFSVCAEAPLSQGASLSFSFPSGVPDQMAPSTPTSFDVQITATGESIVTGTPTLHYRYDGGSWLTDSLTSMGGGLYEATLPAAGCSDTPEFYVSAEGDGQRREYESRRRSGQLLQCRRGRVGHRH